MHTTINGGASKVSNTENSIGDEFRLKGVALDLDGTALRSDHSVSPGLMELGKELNGRNIWLTLASGRPPRSVRAVAELLSSGGPWIALNGAIVFSRRHEIVWRRSLPASAVLAIKDFCASEPKVSHSIYSGFDWLVSRYDERIDAEAKIVGLEPTLLPPTTQLWPIVDKILLIVAEGQERDICKRLMSSASEIRATVSKPAYVEVTHRAADKAAALSMAAGMVRVDIASMLAAGDGENDIAMLSMCGMSMAMAQSSEIVKRAARFVIGTNDDGSLESKIRSLLNAKRRDV